MYLFVTTPALASHLHFPFSRGSPSSLMSFLPQAPPPSGLDDARRSLSSYRTELDAFNVAIEGEESRLAELIQETQRKIAQMKQQRAECEQKITETLAYLSPLRRLPQELLRYTFLLLWKDNPCCGWTLASVSSGWRRLALSTPQLWRKVSPYIHCYFLLPVSCGIHFICPVRSATVLSFGGED